jgi:hypothetical protein
MFECICRELTDTQIKQLRSITAKKQVADCCVLRNDETGEYCIDFICPDSTGKTAPTIEQVIREAE